MKQALIIANMLFVLVSAFGVSAMNLSPNWQLHNGRTQLTQAVYDNDCKRILILVDDQKENINQIDKCGDTPLTLAVKLQDQDLFEMLVLLGADLNLPNERGETPVALVEKSQNQDLYKKLIELQRGSTSFTMENLYIDDLESLCNNALEMNAQIRESIDKEDFIRMEENRETFVFVGFIKNTVQGFVSGLSWLIGKLFV